MPSDTEQTTLHSHEITYDHLNSLDPNLTCSICKCALIDPVTTKSCKHTFCRECIETSVKFSNRCPIDRSVLNIGAWRDTEMLVKLMLDELKVRCTADGCGQVMQRGLLLSHIRTCQKTIVTCNDGDCGLSMSRNRLSRHRAYECFQRKMECGRCGTMLVFKDRTITAKGDCCEHDNQDQKVDICELCGDNLGVSQHTHAWICPGVRMPCTHSNRGCSALIRRSDLEKHLKSCPFEALSSFFSTNDAKLKALNEKTDRLERDLHDLRFGFEQFRRTLSFNADGSASNPSRRRAPGPLDEFDDTQTLLQTSRAVRGLLASELASSAQPQSPGEAIGTQNTAITTFNDPTTALSIDPRPTAAQAALHPDPIPRGPTRSIVAPSFGSHQSYADWAFNRLATTDPNTSTLEQVVERLKRVVIHLAAGMDTMERRNEVRNMTESLRVLEEVGSLRAIVTTLRMQVMMNSSPSRRTPFQLSPAPTHSLPTDHPFSQSMVQSQTQGQTTQDGDSAFSWAFSNAGVGGGDARSSTSSLVVSTARATAARGPSQRRRGQSGAGLTGRPVGIPSTTTTTPAGRVGESSSESGTGRNTHRLSRANPMNLLNRRPPSSFGRGIGRSSGGGDGDATGHRP